MSLDVDKHICSRSLQPGTGSCALCSLFIFIHLRESEKAQEALRTCKLNVAAKIGIFGSSSSRLAPTKQSISKKLRLLGQTEEHLGVGVGVAVERKQVLSP